MPRVLPTNASTIPGHATRVFKGEIFDVYQWPQELYDGSTATFEMLRRADKVMLLCVKDDRIALITEEQPNRPIYTQLPGGRVDEGEEWQVAAERECLEELGFKFKNWRLIDVRQPAIKIEWFVAAYLATDCIFEGERSLDPGEKITIEYKTFDEAKAFIVSNTEPFNASMRAIFEAANTIEDLKALPEFKGKVG